VAGGAGAAGAAPIFKLASNESALGASPKAIAACAAAAAGVHQYPDGSALALREKLGRLYGLDPAKIVCANGSDEVLQLLARAYVGEGDNVVQSEFGFLVYALATKACGGEIRFAKEKNLTADIDAVLSLVDERTRIVFIANPNNPTGTYIADEEVRRLRRELKDDVLLVIDAAYAEFMEEPDYDAGARLVDESDNVVMTRTFSKIYGLAGLRLGWAYLPPAIADVMNRIRGPFNVSGAALAAGLAALDDQDFVARNRAHNRAERDFLQQRLGGMGLDFTPSRGNFILVRFPDKTGLRAPDILLHLRRGGVIVRDMGAYNLGERLRVTIGAREANRRFIELLQEKFPS
ncbi:MAG: histidinol-phosphate transaminase, partial [Parvularculaceae bacterium]